MNKSAKFTPIADQVTIAGDPAVGNTLTGSYLYQNPPEYPEGDSKFAWYQDDQTGTVVATTRDLTVLAEHAGTSLVFSVTPVSSIGEVGLEKSSAPVHVARSGFQNISDEESENSYLKQRGQFAFHGTGPKDGVISATSGAFAFKSGVTHNVSVLGAASHGGTVPPEVEAYLKNNPAITMFTNQSNFAALVPNGDHNQLIVWGPGLTPPLPDLQDIQSVYANGTAIAFIYKNPAPGANTINAVGPAAAGGVVPVEIQSKLMFDHPRAIYSTLDAFAALTESGKVYVWGNPANGGAVSKAIQQILDGMVVDRIVASSTAFCALTATGRLIAWGANGEIPPEKLTAIYDDVGAMNVVANDGAFVAITLGRRKAVTWGLAGNGGTMSATAATLAAQGNLVMCAAAPWAMCFINESGQAAAWGNVSYGGADIPAQGASGANADSRTTAEVAIEEGDTLAQIEQMFKNAPLPRTPPRRVSNTFTFADGGTVELQRNDGSFVLLNRHPDGRTKAIAVWGIAAGGGDLTTDIRQVLMASRVREIYSSNGAYAVLVDQGMVQGVVVTWGRPTQDGGTIPPDLREPLNGGVIHIYAMQARPTPSGAAQAAFAALKPDGTVVMWGAHIPNEVHNPAKS